MESDSEENTLFLGEFRYEKTKAGLCFSAKDNIIENLTWTFRVKLDGKPGEWEIEVPWFK